MTPEEYMDKYFIKNSNGTYDDFVVYSALKHYAKLLTAEADEHIQKLEERLDSYEYADKLDRE